MKIVVYHNNLAEYKWLVPKINHKELLHYKLNNNNNKLVVHNNNRWAIIIRIIMETFNRYLKVN
jgi:hypothetical protein